MEFKRKPAELLRDFLAILLVVLAAMLPVWSAGENAIAVLYPDIGDPYRRIFQEIITGVEDKAGTELTSYPVSADSDIGELKNSLRQKHIKLIGLFPC